MLRTAILAALIVGAVSAVALACERDESLTAERETISAFYTGFLNAAANARVDELDDYWSSLCSEDQRRQQEGTLSSARQSFEESRGDEPIQFVVLRPDEFAFEVVELQQVIVPADQPAGVLEMRIGEQTMPVEEGGFSVTLLREEGVWKVGTCDVFGQSVDEGPECREEPTVTAGNETTPVTVPTPTAYLC